MKLTLTVVLLLLACGCVTEIIPARMQSSTRTALERPGTQLGEAVRLEVGAGEEDVTLSVGGHTAVLPAGRSGALQVSSTEATTGETEMSESAVEAAGAGLQSTDAGAVAGFESELPQIESPGVTVTGGSTLWQRVRGESKGLLVLYSLTGLVFMAGVVLAVFLGKRLMGLCVCAAALVLLAIVRLLDVYPWAPFLGLGVAAIVGLWFVLDWWLTLRKAKAADKRFEVVSGALETVKVADPAAAEPVLQVLRAQPKAVQDDLSAHRIKGGG